MSPGEADGTGGARPAAMRWASAAARLPTAAPAAEAVAEELRAALGEGPVDLALAFFTAPHLSAAEEIRGGLAHALAPGCLAGTSAGGVISSRHEIEEGPALVVLAARLPEVTVSPFLLTARDWARPYESGEDFALAAPGAAEAELLLVFGDPFTLAAASVLESFRRFAPGRRVVGGLSGAGGRAGENVLFLNEWHAHGGGFALALAGAVRADTLVSQGCRPVGPPLRVTAARRNVVAELDGAPAAERVRRVLARLPAEDRALLEHGLLVGRPLARDAEGRGDYLIRGVVGHDPESGALAIGDLVPEGEALRLHLRDAAAARADLEMLLAPQAFDTPAAAALVCSCNGRGRRLFGAPDGDVAPVREALGAQAPIAGLFCAGEIGPVGGANHLHGHTASIAILRDR